jgi:PIF1-like helicase
VNTCPFIPIDNNDENSAYATLLLHTPWSCNGESALIVGYDTAVAKLSALCDASRLPTYVAPMYDKQLRSNNLSNNHGTISNNNDANTQYDSDQEIEPTTMDTYEPHSYSDPTEELIHHDQMDIPATPNENVTTQLSTIRHTYYKNFIQNAQADYIEKQKLNNQISSSLTSEITNTNPSMQTINRVDNYDERCAKLTADILKLTNGQKEAYDKAVDHISGRNPAQLIMFISGEGGTGKSFIIALIMEYTRLLYGKQVGLYGAAVAMAPTGCAANVIKGYTWQSCYAKGRGNDKSDSITMTQSTARKVGEKFKGTKLIVLDEISMINLESIAEISLRHQKGLLSVTDDPTEKCSIENKPFGGTHILFTGDLWQLQAIGGNPIYTSRTMKGRAALGQEIWHSINEYSELTENYRFKNDTTQTLRLFLKGAREGNVDEDLMRLVNRRITLSIEEAMNDAHPEACWIAHLKETVKELNNTDFRRKVAAGIVHFRIVATHTPAEDIHPTPGESERRVLYQTTKKGGPPTHIDLAIGSRVSCVQNLGTQIGKNTNLIIQYQTY